MRVLFSWIIICIFFLPMFVSCAGYRHRRLVLGNDTIAEGRINSDTMYDGVIKFYSRKDNRLMYSSSYVDGILNGISTDYWENGLVAARRNFSNGKLNGYTHLYNKLGILFRLQYYYYGLCVGPSISYSSMRESEYTFYSFDYKSLFHIDYDSLRGKDFTKLDNGYFFYDYRDYTENSEENIGEKRTEIFLYLLNPPKFKFKYDLVAIDDSFKVKSILRELYSDSPWIVFDLPMDIADSGETNIALRLAIHDSINDEKYTTFKKLVKSVR